MPDVTPTPEAPEVDGANVDDLGDAGKKAIAAERRRADSLDKELKALKAAATERETAELSELERFKKENDELRNGKTASDLAAIRLQVALEKGIPASLVNRLQGADYDSIAADADSLSELVSGNKQTGPRVDPSQGPKAAGGSQSPSQQFGDFLKDQLGR